MKTKLQKWLVALTFLPLMTSAQIDLVVGINYSYNPPNNCNNLISNLAIDVCNNGSSAAGSFIVGIYLYDTGNSQHWVIDQVTVNSLSGNACLPITNWNINMNNYCCLPPPGNNYRIGVWVDTANVISETNENNNAGLLSGNIQVCASTSGILELKEVKSFNVFPNPVIEKAELKFDLLNQENVSVVVTDVTGKVVLNSFNGDLYPGAQTIALDLSKLNNGVYFVRMGVSSGVITRKLIVQK